MAEPQFNEPVVGSQGTPGYSELESALSAVDAEALLSHLWEHRRNGRPGYPLAAMWRAYLCSFLLDLPHTNALIRRLQDDTALRLLCGFGTLPHRSTFNRFVRRLADHRKLVDACLTDLTAQLANELPGFGKCVAIDSTTVRTHSNPNRQPVSDPEASWTAKTTAGAKEGKVEWRFGYKYHLVADATHGLPIAGFTTTASHSDFPTLPQLLDLAASTYAWFAPQHVLADKGYDSEANHQAVVDRGGVPVIPLRKPADGRPREGIYVDGGVPTCIGQVPMEYVRSDPKRGHLYRCPPEGCHLKGRKGVRYCHDEHWEDRRDRLRLFGPLRRGSPEWKALYGQRQSVERVFKGMKESRRLEEHCVRGLKMIALHASMSALAFQATALANVLSGQLPSPRWMVRKVA